MRVSWFEKSGGMDSRNPGLGYPQFREEMGWARFFLIFGQLYAIFDDFSGWSAPAGKL